MLLEVVECSPSDVLSIILLILRKMNYAAKHLT